MIPGTEALFDQNARYWLAKTKIPDFFQSVPSVKRALDLGCGGGRLLRFLASRCDELYAIDCSGLLVEAVRHVMPAATVVCGDFQDDITWETLPAVDLVVSNCSLRKDYCPKLKEVVAHCKRHSKYLMLRIQSVEDLNEVLPEIARRSLFYSQAEIEDALEGWQLQILEERFRQKFSTAAYFSQFLERIGICPPNPIATLNPLRYFLAVTAIA